MNNKLIILWIVMLLITIAGAFAGTDNASIGYSYDDGQLVLDQSGVVVYDGTNNGMVTGATGKLKQAFDADANTDYINPGSYKASKNTDWTVSMWINPDVDAEGEEILELNGGYGWISNGQVGGIGTANKWCFNVYDAAHKVTCGTTDVATATWYHLVGVMNSSGNYLWVNGVSESGSGGSGGLGGTTAMYIGNDAGGITMQGQYDMFLFYNYSLPPEEILELWNGGTGLNPYATPAVDTVNLSTIIYPLNDTQYNVNTISINLTGNLTNTTNCSLYINSTYNQSTTVGSGIEVPINYSVGFADGAYNFYVSCTDLTAMENTTINYFYIDVNAPIINSNFTANKLYYNTNITTQMNFTDNLMLHSYNISIDSNEIEGKWDLNSTFYQVNFSYDTRLLAPGKHNLSIRLADGHTATELLDPDSYNPTNGLFNDYIKYRFQAPYNYGSIKIQQKDSNIFDTWKTEELNDRYIFSFEPAVQSNSYIFEVEADSLIHIVEAPSSEYKKWLVYDNHWLDFMPYTDVEFVRISENKVEVTINNVGGINELEFNSIGDLNVVTATYDFYTANVTMTYSSTVVTYEQQTITLLVNKSNSSATSTANLTWNGTQQIVSKATVDAIDTYTSTFITSSFATNVNVSFYWNFTVNSSTNQINGSITANQSVYFIGIDNCSTYTAKAKNFTIRDDSNETILDGVINGFFKIWVDDELNFSSFNLTWDAHPPPKHYGLCISPASATYNVYGQMEYQDNVSAYDAKTYYFQNTTLDNVTEDINLYLTKDATSVTFSVIDENDDDVSGVLIKVLKYDIGTDSYIINEIIQTDDNGNAVGHIILNTQFYKFILELNGKLIFESEPTKITSTAKTFRVTLGTNVFADYNTAKGAIGNVEFDNSTLTFSYVYSDTTNSVDTGCLEVTKMSINGNTILSSQCVNSAASTMTYAINESVGTSTYIGEGFVLINNENYMLDSEIAPFDQRHKVFGLESLFVVLLLVLTMAMVGVSSSSPAISVILMALGLVMSVVMGIFFLSWFGFVAYIIMAGFTLYRITR